MRLSRDEDNYLSHWMYDEVHYQNGPGPAKRLQLQHRAIPADLAVIIAAAIPDPIDQDRAGEGPPPLESPTWPWSEDSWRDRVAEARAVLAGAAEEEARSDGVDEFRDVIADRRRQGTIGRSALEEMIRGKDAPE